jgi:hypothetical protein
MLIIMFFLTYKRKKEIWRKTRNKKGERKRGINVGKFKC